ncbi:hypothetical protein C7B61_12320 [filamentous cyanobacterium CCP1]|nr:hypothetical protein C7B76_25155 [filamentous cyanobacterium CCP2]PSB64363.1 hypothetical protein C7B61_12285 [filamentous cyanobacterium CCP1]PSB64367.1 hypothetical protein C7B61_12320 [filamentous cyanobacterium CCP1]
MLLDQQDTEWVGDKMEKTCTDLLEFMGDSERISVVLPSETKKALEKLCQIEKRSISNFVYLLIQEAIDRAKVEGKLSDDI